jgi:hypothetical protein
VKELEELHAIAAELEGDGGGWFVGDGFEHDGGSWDCIGEYWYWVGVARGYKQSVRQTSQTVTQVTPL